MTLCALLCGARLSPLGQSGKSSRNVEDILQLAPVAPEAVKAKALIDALADFRDGCQSESLIAPFFALEG